jgi:chemotaxis protein CheC
LLDVGRGTDIVDVAQETVTVNAQDDTMLTHQQLEALGAAFQRGAAQASAALEGWLERPALITVDSIEQRALHEVANILGAGEEPICFCAAEMTGRLTGELILAFDDASGLMLADMLLNQPPGTAREWNEMETSAALETTNIVGCAYLNALAKVLPVAPHDTSELIPSPPRFRRDFAESLLQFALMSQAVATNHVVLAKARFQIDASPVHWTLLLVPDAESVRKLRSLPTEDTLPADVPQVKPGL